MSGLTLVAVDATLRNQSVTEGSDSRFVYFIRAVSGGPIKIGVGTDPAQRLAVLQPGNPEKLRILGVIPGAGHKRERQLHLQFGESRLNGEWFKPTPELLATIETEAVAFNPPPRPEIERATLGLDVDGQALRSLRKAQGLSANALAHKAGVSYQHLLSVETGERRPNPPAFRRICDALGLDDNTRNELACTRKELDRTAVEVA